MPLGDQLAEPILGDMGIDLGGGDVGMAQHLLDAAEIGAVVDQVGGEGVPEHVGGQPLGIQTRLDREILESLGEAMAGQVS